MALTAEALRAYLKAAATDLELVTACLERASALVATRTEGATVPEAIVDEAVQRVAVNLWKWRSGVTGAPAYDGTGFAPVQAPNDPMRAADDILRPYVGMGLA